MGTSLDAIRDMFGEEFQQQKLYMQEQWKGMHDEMTSLDQKFGTRFDLFDDKIQQQKLYMQEQWKGVHDEMTSLDRKVENRLNLFDHKIRGEFQQQKLFMQEQWKEVHHEMTSLDRKVGNRLNLFDDQTRGEFQQQNLYMQERWKEMRDEMTSFRLEVSSGVNKQHEQIQRELRNGLRCRGWENIERVFRIREGKYEHPIYFPKTVRDFWLLQSPSRIYLATFYGLQVQDDTPGSWAKSPSPDRSSRKSSKELHSEGQSKGRPTSKEGMTQSSSPSNSEKGDNPLITAIRADPTIAHRSLANFVGLKYDEVRKFMRRAERYDRSQRELKHGREDSGKEMPRAKTHITAQIISESQSSASPSEESFSSGPLEFYPLRGLRGNDENVEAISTTTESVSNP
ncbi:MAG: hypothetical protein M1837_000186 [Sclerophora amabilis]|nr:MAG: hypothetical protein M1837_000186 [Sclerophora amabilis]